MDYKRILKDTESLQGDLMRINNYSEEVYQAFNRLIDELEECIDSEGE